jgi:hypothetical protein
MRSNSNEPPHKFLKLQDTGANTTLDCDRAHRHCLESENANETRDNEARGYATENELSALINLMSNQRFTGSSNREENHTGAEAKSPAARTISEPIRTSEMGIYGIPPPRRFYRTFWRALAKRALSRVELAV